METVLFIETMTHGIPLDKIKFSLLTAWPEPDAHAVILVKDAKPELHLSYKIVTRKWKLGREKGLDKKGH